MSQSNPLNIKERFSEFYCYYRLKAMVRLYKRKLGSRCYKNYTEETLSVALSDIRSKKLSLREASEKYKIHKNTLWLKTKGRHEKNVGRQKVFSETEEEKFVNHAIAMSIYGFPITSFDLRCIVKSYLDRCGRKVACFRNNFPGPDWAKSFMKRHDQILTQRIAKNISHSRAATDEAIVNDFFDHLEKEIEGIPSCNIWNYDETNLVDDPGSKKVLTKRGTKYPETIRNASKACTSIMFCGNAEGQLAPLYVNYKSEKLWSTWTENGPTGARYNRTKSGWFDHQSFEDWFTSLLLPILKKQTGTKVIIGDNLSSHINLEVLNLCQANNIKFIALPPNSTHLLQPLDVAYFRSMKGMWRKVLDEWKSTSKGSKCSSIPKDEFPKLLKILMERLVTGPDNLIAGFRKAGIAPLDRAKVLSRLYSQVADKENISQSVGETFLAELEKRRTDATKPVQKKRRKRLNVVAGKSISACDIPIIGISGNSDQLASAPTENVDDPKPSTSGISKKKANKRSKRFEDGSSESGSEEIVFDESDDSIGEEDFSELFAEHCCEENNKGKNGGQHVKIANINNITVGDYVIFTYEDNLYPGQVTFKNNEVVRIKAMERYGDTYWKWPLKLDELDYTLKDILVKIDKPIQVSRREIFIVNEIEKMLYHS